MWFLKASVLYDIIVFESNLSVLIGYCINFVWLLWLLENTGLMIHDLD